MRIIEISHRITTEIWLAVFFRAHRTDAECFLLLFPCLWRVCFCIEIFTWISDLAPLSVARTSQRVQPPFLVGSTFEKLSTLLYSTTSTCQCRFCYYPQELVLELQWPSRIINMQMLCHEYKAGSIYLIVLSFSWDAVYTNGCTIKLLVLYESGSFIVAEKLMSPAKFWLTCCICVELQIPTKVEVFVNLMTPYVHREQAVDHMKRLGYTSPSLLHLPCFPAFE